MLSARSNAMRHSKSPSHVDRASCGDQPVRSAAQLDTSYGGRVGMVGAMVMSSAPLGQQKKTKTNTHWFAEPSIDRRLSQ